MNRAVKLDLKVLLWIVQGIIVGFGAIMPGLSGGTLCVAFGMYLPIIWVISHPFKNLKKYWKMLMFFGIGGVIGFVGLSGFASWLMDISSELVICAFIGFIIGTFPELWEDAGEDGRNAGSYVSLIIGFALMFTVLFFIENQGHIQLQANIWGFLLCGVLWGLSFIVPGLSSSTLLLFFGLYEPMLDGIAHLSFKVIIPIAFGIAVCVLLLSKGVNALYNKFYNVLSHGIIGVVAATTVMIFPDWSYLDKRMIYNILCIVLGAVVSYIFTKICANLKSKTE